MTGPSHITIAGHTVPIKRDTRARRLILRSDTRTQAPLLVVPLRAEMSQIAAFAQKHLDWIERQSGTAESRPAIQAGSRIPIDGRARIIVLDGVAARAVQLTEDEIHIGGPVDMASNRLRDFLKTRARQTFAELSDRFAAQIEASYSRLAVGDMRSRWGSCSARGTLKYSWRLTMAPAAVQAYVAAHEVCHLREMNHGKGFWSLVEALHPSWRADRAWLRSEGDALQKVDFG